MANSEKPRKQDAPNPNSGLLKAAAQSAVAMPEALRISAQFAVQQQVGPIPPPEILKNYDAVKAGFAERIIKMAEEESAHRREIEKLVVESQAEDQAA